VLETGAGERRREREKACAPPPSPSTPTPPHTLSSLSVQRDALEAAQAVRASADAAYLERDPSDRPPLGEFVRHYAAAAVADLEAALGAAGCGGGGGSSAAAVQAAADRLDGGGGGGPAAHHHHHVLLADVLLARDSLRAALGEKG